MQLTNVFSGKSVQKGKSMLSFIKHSAKNLVSFRPVNKESSSGSPSATSNGDDMTSKSFEKPAITDKTKPNGSSISAGNTTQENSGQGSNVPYRAVAQQDSAQMERSSEISNVLPGNVHQKNHARNFGSTMVQQRSNSLPGKMSQEESSNVSNTIAQQRSYSFPSQITQGLNRYVSLITLI